MPEAFLVPLRRLAQEDPHESASRGAAVHELIGSVSDRSELLESIGEYFTDWDIAQALVDRVLELNPADCDGLAWASGLALQRDKDYRRAVHLAERARESNPSSLRALHALLSAYGWRAQPTAVLSLCSEILLLDSLDRNALLEQARALHLLHGSAAAIASLRAGELALLEAGDAESAEVLHERGEAIATLSYEQAWGIVARPD